MDRKDHQDHRYSVARAVSGTTPGLRMTTLPEWLRLVVIVAASSLGACGFHGSQGGGRNPVEYDMQLARMGAADSQAAIGAEDVRNILRLDAQPMMAGLNELGVRTLQHAAVQVLVAAWQGNATQEPDLNWDELDRNDVRFALANELVRARMNGATDVPAESIAGFARNYVNGQTDEGLLIRAIYLLVLSGNSSDIELVTARISASSSQAVVRAGVSALAVMCGADASRAIAEIRKRLVDPVHVSVVDEVLTESAPFRARRCKSSPAAPDAAG